MSTSVLTQRLTELQEAGLVETGYALTPPGVRLLERLRFFDDWASEWQEQWGRAARVSEGEGDQGGKR